MIKLFGQTDKTFATNGDMTILPLRASVHKEDNGDYYLDLMTSLKYVNDITEGRIVVAMFASNIHRIQQVAGIEGRPVEVGGNNVYGMRHKTALLSPSV